MYVPHDSKMHSTLQGYSRRTVQVRYQPDLVTAIDEKLFQSGNKISDNRLKRTWKSERQEDEVRV